MKELWLAACALTTCAPRDAWTMVAAAVVSPPLTARLPTRGAIIGGPPVAASIAIEPDAPGALQ
jgi:hypothetical protein